MIPETIDSSQGFYLIGTIVLVIGVLAVAAAALIRRRLEEEQRDERYVRERRGEEMQSVEPPRIAALLQYTGLVIGAIGILVLVAGWTLAPGQS
ncbi:MAG TPA: hypothetical protein VMH33_04430 [Solirubrobacterales bacterium]|nr:hypothetical protein [Solirubrobacterales bacterium]